MTCNCGNEKVVVRHVRGNTLTLAIPLQERIRRMVDDEETVETVDYNPLPTDVVTVNLRGFTRTETFVGTDVTITGNVVEVTDNGTIGVGTYGVEILIDSADGKKRRYYSASEIQVVEQTRDAGIDEGTEYDVTTRTLEAAVFDIMRGYSAYEIWLQQGHEGTEADFLEWLRDDSMDGEYVDNAETLLFYHPEWGACNILKNPVKMLNIVADGISEAGAARSTLIFKAAANLSLSVTSASGVSTIQQGSPKFIEENCYVMHFVGVRNEGDASTHVVCWFDSKLATVAYTGSYKDLEDKPTIPVLPSLAAVATSGLYADLIGRPFKGVYAYTDIDELIIPGLYGVERADEETVPQGRPPAIRKYAMELLLVTYDDSKTTQGLDEVHQTLFGWDGRISMRKLSYGKWSAWEDRFGTAAYTNSYTDLKDKPTIPDLSTLAKVARTGDYNDLDSQPIRHMSKLRELDGDGWYMDSENALLWATYDESNDRYAATIFVMDGTTGLSILFGVVSDGVFNDNYSVQMGAVNDHIFNKVVHITAAERTAWNGKYTKPASGIPASDIESGVIPTVPTNVSAFTNDAGYLTSHQDINGKADKVVVVDASTLPASLEPNKVYQMGTLTGSVTIPPFSAVASGDTEAKIWCFTFSTGSTAPTITWPAGITGWSGGSAPTISASKSYEVSVMDGIAVIIEV